MELTGNTADRWEQISNIIGEIATSISAKQELIKGISSTIDELSIELGAERKVLEQLSNLALKEVLREESGTLNDEDNTTTEPPKIADISQSSVKAPAKKAPKKVIINQEVANFMGKHEDFDSNEPKVFDTNNDKSPSVNDDDEDIDIDGLFVNEDEVNDDSSKEDYFIPF